MAKSEKRGVDRCALFGEIVVYEIGAILQKEGMKKAIPLANVYQLLEPGPVVLLATQYKGKDNVMTMSWHMMMDFEPPIVGCVISNQNYTFELIRRTKECVIAIPTVEMAKKVVAVGNVSGLDVDKFHTFELAKESASHVKAPILGDCYANLECKVIDTKMANKYNMFVLEVVAAWSNPSIKNPQMIHHLGNGLFVADGKKFKIPSKKK